MVGDRARCAHGLYGWRHLVRCPDPEALAGAVVGIGEQDRKYALAVAFTRESPWSLPRPGPAQQRVPPGPQASRRFSSPAAASNSAVFRLGLLKVKPPIPASR